MTRLIAVFLLCASYVLAADIDGTWKGKAEGPNGTIERTFMFKADGTKLTGETTSEMLGKSEIKNGKIEGNKITFSIDVKFQDNPMTITYTGTVSGSDLKLSADVAGNAIEWTAKKVS